MRLIDADTLKKSAYLGYHTPGEIDPMVVDADDIDDAPTIDAVPVVRCGECRKYQTQNCHAGHEQGTADYCSHGIRKDDPHA